MPKEKPFKSGTVSAKLKEQEHDLLQQVYERLYGSDCEDPITFKEFIVNLMEKFNAEPVNNDSELESRITDLEHENFRLRSELTIEKEKQGSIPENSIIVPLEPVMIHFLKIMSEAATKKANKDITASDILKNLFWRTIKDGPGDYLPLILTRSEIKSEILKIKQ